MAQTICVTVEDIDAARLAVHAHDLGLDADTYLRHALSLFLSVGEQLLSKDGLRICDKNGDIRRITLHK